MSKHLRIFLIICFCTLSCKNIFAQSTITVSPGASISVGNGSNLAGGYRDGTMLSNGTFNSRSIVFDPVTISGTFVTQSSFYANWNASAGANGYKLDVSTNPSFSSFVTGFQNLDVGNSTSFLVNNLSASTNHYYRVRAYDIDGITGYSNTTLAITGPPIPTAIAATNINEASYSANWNASTGATGYWIDVSTTAEFTAGTFVTGFENKNVGNVTTYSITGLTANSTYYYRVRAFNSNGTSVSSNVITTLTASSPPVCNTATPITQLSFSANWNSATGATKYFLDVSTVNTFASFVTGYNALDVADVTSYSVSGLTSGTTYYYRVRSNNGNGTSTNSNVVTVNTIPPDPIATSASSLAQTSFSANWGISTGASNYYIDVSNDIGFTSFVTNWENISVGNLTTVSVSANIAPGSTYYYRIRSANSGGISGNSNIITVYTAPPNPVTIAASSISQSSFVANWNASTTATKYYLDIATDNAFTAIVNGWNNVDVGINTSFTVNSGLTSGTVYYYRVRALNASGISGNSNVTSTILVSPNPVATAATNITQSSFSANWNATAGATKYYLDVATDAGFTSMVTNWSNVDVGNVLTYSVNSNLTLATDYYFRVRAENSNGLSGNSNVINLVTAPIAPIATAGSNSTTSSFTANWNAAATATGYLVDVSTDNSFGVGTFITGYNGRDVGNVLTYSISANLSSGTTYYYRVRAYNTGGKGANSNTITFGTKPLNPITAAATSVGGSGFDANWNSISGATGYRLDVSTVSNFSSFVGAYNDLDVSNVLTYSVTGLSSGTVYYFRVRAYNNYGSSNNSGNINVLTAPAAPVTASATLVGVANFTANWASSAGANGYYLDVSAASDFSSFLLGFNSKDVGNLTSYLIPSLSAGTNYYYRVRAYNTGGTSSNSITQTIVTLPAAPPASAATSITAIAFDANWSSSSSATGYKLDVSTDASFGDGNYVTGFQNKDVGNVVTYTVSGLTAGTTYYYRVRGYNASGTDGNSPAITVVTIPPSPVEQVASSITKNSFSANWSASSGANGYYLDVSTNSGFTAGTYVTGYQNLDVGKVLTYTITGLSSSTQYYYRIRAHNLSGSSGNSGTASPITAIGIPKEPATSPASSIAGTSFAANWVASVSAASYRLDVSTVSDFSSFVTGWNDVNVGNVLTYLVNTDISAGTTYYYRVRAVNAEGTSSNSSVISLVTIPAAPVEKAATVVSNTGFTANWNASTGAAGYKLDVSTANDFSSFVSGYNDLDVSNTTSYVIKGLIGSTTYYYRIRAYNFGGTSTNSGVITQATDADPVGTVNAIAASVITASGFNANWNTYTGATGYKIDVSTASDFSSFVATYNALDMGNVTTFTINGLSGGTNYYYRIIAYDGTGTIANSGNVAVLTIPAAPTSNAASSIAELSFIANWTASTGATGYNIDVATNDTFTNFVTGFNDKFVNVVTNYSVTGLAEGTTYYYRVRAINGSGVSASSSTITVVTIPTEPGILIASSIQSSSFDANWSSVTNATGYKLDVSTVSDFSSLLPSFSNLDVGNVTTKSVTGLDGGTTYYYRVKAYNANGTGNSSTKMIVTTLPASPTATAATLITKTDFNANWNSATGASKYYLDVATTIEFSAGTFVTGFENVDVGSSTSAHLTGLSGGTNYYYRVRSYNGNGTSTSSNKITVLTVPSYPIIQPASGISNSSFNANWSASTGAANYYLDVATDIGFTSMVSGWNNVNVGNVVTYNVNSGLSVNTTYYYRVRSYNASGTSDNSGIATVITGSASPVAIAATSFQETNFVANWNSIANADGYRLDVSIHSDFSDFISGFNNKDVGDVTSYTITGLVGGTTYYYRVRTYVGGRISGNSNLMTALTRPSAPSAIATSAVTSSGFTANWLASTGSTKYYLEVSSSSDFSSYVAGFDPKDALNATSYSVTGLNSNTTYYYRISANNASGTGAVSNIVSILTSTAAPTSIAATSITNVKFNANWIASAGATGYYLDVASDASFTNYISGFSNLDVGNVITYQIINLSGSTNYYYRVRAYNSGGTSGNSAPQTVTTLINPSGVPFVSAASALAETSFTANWSSVSGATGYRIDVATNLTFTNYVSGFQDLDVGNVLLKSITGLNGGTTYYYRLRSYNISGLSSNSSVITSLTLPATPGAIAASSTTQTSFAANWNPTTGTTKYYLDVSTDVSFGAGNFVTGYQNLDVGNVTTYSVNTNLATGTTYFYRVKANNTSGTSNNSNGISVLTISPNPTSIAGTSITGISFNANWNTAASATGYKLDVSTDNGFGSGTFLAGFENKDVGNVTTFSMTDLDENTNYYYRVRSYNGSGESGNSGTITVLTAPTAPVTIAASNVTANSFNANWNATTGATGYLLDVSSDSNFGTGLFITGYEGKDIGNVTTYSVSSLLAGTTYYYRVRAYNSSGPNGNSNVQTVLTLPSAPVATGATSITETSFNANWNIVTSATGYKLEVSTVSDFSSYVNEYNNLDVGNVTTYSVTGLTEGENYYIRVSAYNGTGTGAISTVITVLTKPEQATAIAATAVGKTSLTANWNTVKSATKYYLELSTKSDFSSYVSGYDLKDVGNVTSFLVTGLSQSSTYYYRVSASNPSGVGVVSNAIMVMTVPSGPVASAATLLTSTSFQANWSASAGAEKYFLDVSTDINFGAGNFISGYENIHVGDVTSYLVNTNLSGATTYYYRVRAYNLSGTSENSSTISVLTIPTEPTSITAGSITQTAFNANWNSSAGAIKYYLDVSTDASFGPGNFVTGYQNIDVGNVTTYLINTNITSGTIYYYRIRSNNSSGTSVNSNSISVITIAPNPTATSGSNVASTSFSSNWNAVTGASGYFLDVSALSDFSTFVTGYNSLDVGNVTTYSVTGLSTGTTYYYRVRAYNASGNSGNSGTITVLSIPSAPTATTAGSLAQTSFAANWNATTGATKYYLDVSTDINFGAGTFVTNYENKDVGNVTTYSVTGLSTGTTYYYRLRANNASGTGSNSGTITALTIPAAATATTAGSLAQTSFSANWNSSIGAAKYYLDVSTDVNFGAGNFITGYQNLDVGNVTTYSVNTNLTAGVTYYYRVRSNNTSGTSENSNVISALTISPNPIAAARTNITGTSFSANWNTATSATGYKLDVSTDINFGIGTFVTGLDNKDVGNVITYSITGLSENTNYYYRVRSYNGSGESGNSGTITVLTKPSAPVTVAATTIQATSFASNWNSVTGVSGYNLDVSASADFTTFVTGYNSLDVGNVTTYSVTGLSTGTTYYYRVRAYNASGSGVNSGTITVLTIPTAPNAITAGSLTQTSFAANWNATISATKYYLDVSTDINFGAGTFVTNYENKDVGNVTTYSVTGLSTGTTYYYRLRANNASGTGSNSGTITALTIPAAATATTAGSLAQTSFSANWNSSIGAAKYYLDVSMDVNFGAGNFITGYQNLDVGNVTTYSVNTNLTAGVTYYYRVRSNNTSGTSENSNVISALTISPNPIAAARTNITGTSFSANWNTATSATGYKLDVSTDINFGIGTFVTGLDNKDVGNVITYSITGLSENTNYYYRVRSYNGSGESGNSGTITVLTSPVAPVAIAATIPATTSFVANWNVTTGATGYYLDVSSDSNFGVGLFVSSYEGKDVGNVTSYSVNTNLAIGTTYYYRVRAYNTGGTGLNSNPITIATLPTNPTVTAGTNLTPTSFSANWNMTLGATGYYLDVSTVSDFTSRVSGYDNLNVGNVATYSVTGLNTNTIYYYRVRGYHAYGTGGNSGVITVLTKPSAPVTIAATTIQATSFSSNWNAVTGVSGYFLDVSTDMNFGAGTFVTNYENKDVGNVTTHSINGLSTGTTYYYRVRAYNASGYGDNSNIQSLLTLPSAPVASTATTIQETSFLANWNSTSSAVGYKLDVSTFSDFSSYVSGFNNLEVGNVITSLVTGLAPGTIYYLRVRAYNGTGVSANSNTITVLTKPDAVIALNGSLVTETNMTANWNAVNSATNYFLEVATTNDFSNYITGYNLKDVGNVTSYSVTGLKGSSIYYYRISARNASGTGLPSNIISVLTAPSPPVANEATLITNASYQANWNSVIGATGYKLDVSTDASFAAGKFVILVTDYNNLDVGNVTNYLISGLSGQTQYYYRVRAYNTAGTSLNSNTINLVTLIDPPTTPVSSAATFMTQTSFTANWNLVQTAIGYRLDLSTDSNFANGSFVAGYQDLDVGNIISYSVNTNLKKGTTYYYRIRGYNAGGISNSSGSIAVMTIPEVPLISNASLVTSNSFQVNWNSITGASGYYLDVALDKLFTNLLPNYNNINVINANNYSITGLSSGVIYYYRIRAYNESGNSPYSETESAITIPGSVTAAEASSILSTGFNANWNAVIGASGYRLDVSTNSLFAEETLVTGYKDLDVKNVLTYPVTGLAGGTNYYYRLRPYNSSGTSISSNTISLLTKPSAPVAISSTSITDNGFIINWNAVKSATKYFIDLATDSLFTNFVAGYTDLDVGNENTFTISSLASNTKYFSRIRAFNSSGVSSNSNTIRSSTAITGTIALAATFSGANGFIANWNLVSGATKYFLDVATDELFNNIVTKYNNVDVGNVSTFTVTDGISSGTNYYYRVRAANENETGKNSNIIKLITIPAIPVALVASQILNTGFTANWNSVQGADGYSVDVAMDDLFTQKIAGWENNKVGKVTSVTINTGNNIGSTFYYRIRSENQSGISPYSNTISVISIPDIPVATKATGITENSFAANWNPVKGATKYYLDIATDKLFTSLVDTWNNVDVGDVTTYSINKGIVGGITYYYRVRCANPSGTSDNSNVITVILLPSVPVAKSASQITQESFTATWETATGSEKYFLDVATDDSFTKILSDWNNYEVGNVTAFIVNKGLNPGTKYYFRLRALNVTGQSANSNTLELITLPANPIASAASNVQEKSLVSNWNSIVGADGYYLDVSNDVNFNNYLPGYHSFNVGNVNSFQIKDLSGGTRYYYRVAAFNKSGTSSVSNAVEVITLPTSPVAITAVQITQNSFVAGWNSVIGSTKYYIDVSIAISFSTFVSGLKNVDAGNSTSFQVVTNINPGTKYYYRVRAMNENGESNNSNIITVVTIPDNPAALAATEIKSISYKSNWGAVSGATGYYVDVATDNGFVNYLPGFQLKDVGNINSAIVSGLVGGKDYYYRVYAYNESGRSAISNIVQVTTLPSAPVAIAASQMTKSGFIINWNTLTGVTGYNLDVSLDVGFSSYVEGYNKKDIGNVASFSISGLSPGNKYYYRIYGVNKSGISEPSNVISVLLDLVPTTNISATFVDDKINLSWEFDLSLRVSGFIIYRKGNSQSSFGVIDTVKGKIKTYSDLHVQENNSYSYLVVAYNDLGSKSIITETNPSNLILVPIKMPTELTVKMNASRIELKWKDNSSVEDGYIIERSENTNTNFVVLTKVGSSVTAYNDSEIKNGIKYYYRITAYVGSTKSNYSDEVSVIAVITAIEELALGIPKEYQLYQNYPNPFNPTTRIRFALPKESAVKVIVYDIVGREVEILVDEFKSAGYYEVMVRGTKWASGLYIYRVIADEYVNTKKMLLLK